MRTLVVVESLDVDNSSGAKTSLALLQSLAKCGGQITALHYSQKDVFFEDINCVSINETKWSVNYILSRVQRLLYRWFKWDISKYVDGVFGFSFGFFNDSNSIAKAIQKYNHEDFDMIWTLSKGNSYRTHKALLKLPKWHYKWFAYVHDPYPQQLYPRPYNYVPYGYKKKRMFFREVTIHAKRLVFPSLLLKDWMQSYFVAVKEKSLIIPHQTIHINHSKINLPTYFNPAKFNVLHAGNLLDLRNPLPIIKAFEKFLEIEPLAKNESALLFLGNKSVFHDYLKASSKVIPQLHVSEDYVNFNLVYKMQMETAVNVILEAKSEISPFLPGKFPHCVAANKPIMVIGPYYSECKRLLGKDYPFVYEFDDIELITNGFVELYRKWKKNKALELNRDDLVYYLSSNYLYDKINSEME